MSRLPAIQSATHVAFESITADQLSRLGATNVVRANDCLVIGPSRGDPLEHERERDAWWASPAGEKLDLLYSPHVRWAPPVVVWVSASIVQRVNLWRSCKWLRHLGIAAKDVYVLEFEPVPPRKPREGPQPPFNCTASVSHHPDEVLLERFARARPFSRRKFERAASLWDNYTREDPRSFFRACLRGAEGFPELASVWGLLSNFFPGRMRQGALHLSRFDERLLSILTPEWQTPVAVFVHESQAGAELRQLLSCTGDLFVPRRLDQWANHGPNAAVERAAGPKPPGHPMLSSVYRISERGIQLREAGLAQLTDAPGLPIAGTEAYAPGAPWVLLEDRRLVRLWGR